MSVLLKPKPEPPDVYIGMPSYDGTYHEFTMKRLEKMLLYSAKEKITVVRPVPLSGSVLPDLRDQCVKRALEMEAKYLLFIDSDMAFPMFGLKQLMSMGGDVVSGVYVQKQRPYMPIMYEYNKHDLKYYSKMDCDWSSTDPEPVDAVGMGFCLIRTEIFEHIEPPWFAMPPAFWVKIMDIASESWTTKRRPEQIVGDLVQAYRDHHQADFCHGEDMFFCKRVKDAGFAIVVDKSLQLMHIGSMGYMINNFILEVQATAELQEQAREAAKKVKVVN